MGAVTKTYMLEKDGRPSGEVKAVSVLDLFAVEREGFLWRQIGVNRRSICLSIKSRSQGEAGVATTDVGINKLAGKIRN